VPGFIESLSLRDSLLLLNGLPNIGPVSVRRLLDRFGDDPRDIFRASRGELGAVRGVGNKIIDSILDERHQDWLTKEKQKLETRKIAFLENESYPPLLNEIYDPPVGLYLAGEIPPGPYLSIVGTRNPTLYGLRFARELAQQLAEIGFCIVSGMARGIDTAAHEGALDVQGKTLAFLGSGIDIVYPPENLGLYRKIIEKGGVASEFPFGRKADRRTFPMRNRLVAGVSIGVIVIESASITAQFAADQGRTVFALPGRVDQPTSAGCHKLIREGATLLRSARDVVEELGPVLPLPQLASPSASAPVQSSASMSEEEEKIIQTLSDGAILGLDDLCELTRIPAPEVMASLTMLELNHSISKRPDGRYERT
jgi:DNA processing protein